VVAYGFGNYHYSNLLNHNGEESISTRLPFEYHVNKTYVAISRAKKQLFIVDMADSIEKFWRITIDQELINQNLEQINKKDNRWNSSHLLPLTDGTINNLKQEGEIDNEEVAQQFMKSGLSKKNAFMLRQASLKYNELDKRLESRRCEAIVFVFEEKYQEAGRIFRDAGLFADAVNSFWLSEKYNEIREIGTSHPSYQTLRLDIAAAQDSAVKQNCLIQTIEKISGFSERLEVILSPGEYFPHVEMHRVFEKALNKIASNLDTNIIGQQTFERIITIEKAGMEINGEKMGDFAFHLRKYDVARRYYENAEKTNGKNYTVSVAYTTKYPENLSKFGKLDMDKKVIQLYEENQNAKLKSQDAYIVINACLKTGKGNRALDLIKYITEKRDFENLLKSAKESGGKIDAVLAVWAKIFNLKNQSWDDTIELLKGLQRQNLYRQAFYVTTGLAQIPKAPSEIQKKLAVFLRDVIIANCPRIPEKLMFDIGIAIEMTEKFVDALQYYEYLKNYYEVDKDKLMEAVKRLIVAKKHQIRYNKDKNNEDDARAQQIELDGILQEYNIPSRGDDISEYGNALEWAELCDIVIKREFDGKKKPLPGYGIMG
jgi:hypothetical protein